MFKTTEGMLGLGHVAVRSGDVVTLLQKSATPMILRPRDRGGFTFIGDAYVDGIMHGEFLKMGQQTIETFDIY